MTSGHVTKMAATSLDTPEPKTPCCTQTVWLYVLWNWSYRRSKFYIAGIVIFDLFCFCDLGDDLHIGTWPVFPGDIQDVRKLTSFVKTFESYRITDRQTKRQTDRHDRNYIPRRFEGVN